MNVTDERFKGDAQAMIDAMCEVGVGWSRAYGLGVMGLAVESLLKEVPPAARNKWIEVLRAAFESRVN